MDFRTARAAAGGGAALLPMTRVTQRARVEMEDVPMSPRSSSIRAVVAPGGAAMRTPSPATPFDKRAEAKRRLDEAQRRALASEANRHVLAELAKR